MKLAIFSTLSVCVLSFFSYSWIRDSAAPVKANTVENTSYRVENIQLPPGLYGETGGLAFLPDGRLVACFLRGEVMIYTPSTKKMGAVCAGLTRAPRCVSRQQFRVSCDAACRINPDQGYK